MKFAVQPYGATMQPAAEMPGDCTPGQSVLSVDAGMRTPLPSRLRTFLWTLAVYQGAVARAGAATPAAMAVPVQARPRTDANTTATPQLLRIRTYPLSPQSPAGVVPSPAGGQT